MSPVAARVCLGLIAVGSLAAQTENEQALSTPKIEASVLDRPSLHPGLRKYLLQINGLENLRNLRLNESKNTLSHGYSDKALKVTVACDAMETTWRRTTLESGRRIDALQGYCYRTYTSEAAKTVKSETVKYRFVKRVGEGLYSFELASEDGDSIVFNGNEFPSSVPNWLPPLPTPDEVEEVNFVMEVDRRLGSSFVALKYVLRSDSDCVQQAISRLSPETKWLKMEGYGIHVLSGHGVSITREPGSQDKRSCFLQTVTKGR